MILFEKIVKIDAELCREIFGLHLLFVQILRLAVLADGVGSSVDLFGVLSVILLAVVIWSVIEQVLLLMRHGLVIFILQI